MNHENARDANETLRTLFNVQTLSLPANQLALARANTYQIFSRLYLSGPEPALLPLIEDLPELAFALDPAAEDLSIQADNLAADHYQLFGLNVFPYESVFLEAESQLGGPSAEAVAAFYQTCGFTTSIYFESPDHLGIELAFLASQCESESEAWEHDQIAAAWRLRKLQHRFLEEHLLPWLPVFLQAVRQQSFPFYSALADLTFELVAEHFAELNDEVLANAETFRLPPLPELLSESKTGFKEIVAYLLTPAYSGWYLSRDDLARLARELELPKGFGDRAQMLRNLFTAAVDYGHLPELLSRLVGLNAEWEISCNELFAQGELFALIAKTWIERLERTRQVLEEIKRANIG